MRSTTHNPGLRRLSLGRRARTAALRHPRALAAAAAAITLTGCQGMSRVQPVSQVRIIDASPDAPAIDIRQNSATGLYNVGFGTVSSYMAVSPGAYTHAAYTAGTDQQLAKIHGSFDDGGQYTVL